MNNDAIADLFKTRGVVLFDAAMGTALHAAGQPAGVGSEEMNLLAPDTVLRIHRENIVAGSDVVTSNTFGATQMMMRGDREKALRSLDIAVGLARRAAAEGGRLGPERFACLCIGPSGAILGPLGDVGYEAAEEAYALQVEAGARSGADFILLETFADQEEFIRAAVAAMGTSGLPVLGTMTFGEGGRSFMGAAPADFVRAARACGLAAIGANCSLDPEAMYPIAAEIVETAAERAIPTIIQPNAGRPAYKDGKAAYEMETDAFASGAERLIGLGVNAIGGCCGTTPAMISAIRGIIDT